MKHDLKSYRAGCRCIECRASNAKAMRAWLRKNRKRINEKRRQRRKTDAVWREEDRQRSADYATEHRTENIARASQWQRDNREHRNRYFKRLRRTNARYRINHLVAVALNRVVKKLRKGDSWFDHLGYTVEQLESRLRATLPKGAAWLDFMSGRLHIDHIRDKGLFEFSSPDSPELRRAWALTNLRLLWKADNLARPKLANRNKRIDRVC